MQSAELPVVCAASGKYLPLPPFQKQVAIQGFGAPGARGRNGL